MVCLSRIHSHRKSVCLSQCNSCNYGFPQAKVSRTAHHLKNTNNDHLFPF